MGRLLALLEKYETEWPVSLTVGFWEGELERWRVFFFFSGSETGSAFSLPSCSFRRGAGVGCEKAERPGPASPALLQLWEFLQTPGTQSVGAVFGS